MIAVGAKRQPKRRLRDIPLSRLLGVTFGILTAIGIGLVLTLTVMANARNTFSLLNTRAVETIESLELLLDAYMEAPELTVTSIAGQLKKREIDFDDDEALKMLLRGAITANRMVVVLFVVDTEFRGRGAFRQGDTFEYVREEKIANPLARTALDLVPLDGGAVWGPLVFEEGALHANVVHPVVIDGVHRGYVVAALPLPRLSQLTRQITSQTLGTTFILDGPDRVLAHPSLAFGERVGGFTPGESAHITSNRTGEMPPDKEVPIATFSDQVLRAFAATEEDDRFEVSAESNVMITDVAVGDDYHIVLSKSIRKYAPREWIIGFHLPETSINEQMRRLIGSASVGLILLALATALAVYIGRRMGRPIALLNGMAGRVTQLDFDHVQPLAPSRIREFNEASTTLNRMVEALRAFSAYVPRSLVLRLIENGQTAAQSQERQVTVMFTDIVGFTRLSEHMTAADTAEFLNAHFEILCAAVEETGGTVDKFMGDGMMAFWGAPDAIDDHAERAAKAAFAMHAALAQENEKRAARGEPAVNLRVGIHTGPVIVGNIGTHDRINYTIVGDTVNVSQRLEALGKVVAPDDDFVALVSAASDADLPAAIGRSVLKAFHVPGRDAPIQVYRLDT